MKLLILGGTLFLGRHIVDAAFERGHEVTLFNRGRRNPDLFPEVEKLIGDRDGGLDVLRGRKWNAVVDTCGYVPRIVKASAELLSDSVGHYTFISSISVYAQPAKMGIDESDPLGTLEDETVEEITETTYGPLKVLCEQAVEAAFPGRALHVRAGLIVGPHDPSDRFTYWPRRVSQGGDVVAPGDPKRETQFVDVRDLAAWILRMVESGKTGAYNAAGPDYRLTFGGFLEECNRACGGKARLNWLSDDFLLANEVQPWLELPLWIPLNDEAIGFTTVNCQKAIRDGLTFRPPGKTARDTLDWDTERGLPEMKKALQLARESELMEKWKSGSA